MQGEIFTRVQNYAARFSPVAYFISLTLSAGNNAAESVKLKSRQHLRSAKETQRGATGRSHYFPWFI